MTPSKIRPEFALTPLEYDVLCAVVTKFASDLVLFRLSKTNAKLEAAALEEVATAAAVMLNDRTTPTQVESLAVQAIIESVSTGSPDSFYSELCDGQLLPFAPERLKQVVRVIHGKLVASGFRAAA